MGQTECLKEIFTVLVYFVTLAGTVTSDASEKMYRFGMELCSLKLSGGRK
jgi:hypothetical protein